MSVNLFGMTVNIVLWAPILFRVVSMPIWYSNIIHQYIFHLRIHKSMNGGISIFLARKKNVCLHRDTHTQQAVFPFKFGGSWNR